MREMSQLQTKLLQDCVQFLKAIHRYLHEVQPSEGNEIISSRSANNNGIVENDTSDRRSVKDEQTYLNVVRSNPFEDARGSLVAQCAYLLERIEMEEKLATQEENAGNDAPQEVECSYLDMSGTNVPKVNIRCSLVSDPVDEMKEPVLENMHPREEDPFPVMDETSYEPTTDQILYDECQQDGDHGPSEPSSPRAATPESHLDETQCPFGGLPASHLRLQQSPKIGTLFKQEKRLFFDQFKKYYVGLIGKWLLLYSSHNDLKPWQTIYIKGIKLDLSLNEHINEKHLFQIITHTDSKVHFLSPSFQDLNEWIVAIENNLIEKAERQPEGCLAMVQGARKLPLPPGQAAYGGDETDLHIPTQEDGIYEEPALYLKAETDSISKAQVAGYDTPKPCIMVSSEVVLSEVLHVGQNKSELSQVGRRLELPTKNVEPGAAMATPVVATPVKSWLKNKFNRSPTEPCEAKPSKKAMKKLSFDGCSLPDASVEMTGPPWGPIKHPPVQLPSPKFSLSTTPSNKGTKINMIISQLEANGQLNLLSKRLTETNKRYTWVAEDVSG